MIFFIMIISIVIFDQWTKNIALNKLKDGVSHTIWNNKLKLTLYKNKGVALNFFKKYPKFIKRVVILIILILVFFMIKIVNKKNLIFEKIGLGFIIGGGIGNLIDRIKKGYVVDFFKFNFKKCPIFNFADLFIILGSIIIQVLLIRKDTIN
ncbi:signal peptidase II [Defluviitalea phaphyphila]|uniref:signal peptidase II n=1 Tax=Defluviitalea phaphyphila TaxID=1473580 RepID=UPI00072FE520|nr:signal peptidase II [Defluviitalea phaphyphila]